jgi:hypothetical protein
MARYAVFSEREMISIRLSRGTWRFLRQILLAWIHRHHDPKDPTFEKARRLLLRLEHETENRSTAGETPRHRG